ncbi:unnamed protein product [Oppiella nova]|uniref:Uncharacterized protein n=1 Tax=Oppiella nova TaxID=334625 RepID=A0A7R9M8A3_9ACAR|nr:unnamed protein product [Oppiella nova]CAG2172490.1 unnamed protein product [Oppiella nova]
MQTHLDGSNQSVLYDNNRQAFHLTVNYQTQRYYFIDINDFYLYSIDFNGTDERLYTKSKEFFDSVNSMYVLNSDLYLANEYMIYKIPEIDLRIQSIQILHKSHRYNATNYQLHNAVDIDRQEINKFKILDPILQPNVTNVCESHGCLHLCLPTGQSYRCLVPDSSLPDPLQLWSDPIADKLKSRRYLMSDNPVQMSGLMNGHSKTRDVMKSSENLLDSEEDIDVSFSIESR